MPTKPRCIGILGGTFDPVHYGHLRLAEEAAEHFQLAEVRWIPVGNPPHRAPPESDARHRLEMIRMVTGDNSKFLIDDTEVKAAKLSYTYNTLLRLRRELGSQQPLCLLLGIDTFLGLTTWYRWRELFDLTHIVVAQRPGYAMERLALIPVLYAEFEQRHSAKKNALTRKPQGSIATMTMTQLEISASAIRWMMHSGHSPRYLVPESIIDYIRKKKLYQRPNA